MYLPNLWSGISTIFLTDCCSLSFYSGRRDYEGCNSLQPYRLQTHFFWLKNTHTHETHALWTQLCRCVLSLGHWGHYCSSFHNVPAANNRFLFQQSGRMAGRRKSSTKFWPGGSPLQNSDHLRPNKSYPILSHTSVFLSSFPSHCYFKIHLCPLGLENQVPLSAQQVQDMPGGKDPMHFPQPEWPSRKCLQSPCLPQPL